MGISAEDLSKKMTKEQHEKYRKLPREMRKKLSYKAKLLEKGENPEDYISAKELIKIGVEYKTTGEVIDGVRCGIMSLDGKEFYIEAEKVRGKKNILFILKSKDKSGKSLRFMNCLSVGVNSFVFNMPDLIENEILKENK